jgi:hypothetical protein
MLGKSNAVSRLQQYSQTVCLNCNNIVKRSVQIARAFYYIRPVGVSPAMTPLSHSLRGRVERSAPKIAIAEKISSRALRADAMEAVTCGWLSFVVVISLAAQWLFGAWWIDSVGSLAIVWFLIKEGREAWSGNECGCC